MTIRLKLLVATILLTATTLTAQTLKEPDFAFPQDALADADSLLRVSHKSGDNIGVIRAMMIKTVADDAIDRATMQRSISEILREADTMRDKQLRGLMQLYAANCVQSVYDANRWQFNRRQLPLSPRPADMSEWSGEMFRVVIDSLCSSAWDNVGNMSLKDLRSIIDADDLTLIYYPTLRDFAACRICNDAAASDSLRSLVRHAIVEFQKPDSPAYYMWRSQEILEKGDDYYNQLWQLYRSASNRYAALVVWQYLVSGGGTGYMRENSKIYEEIISCMKADIDAYPAAWIIPMLKNGLNSILQPSLSYEVVGEPCPDVPFKLQLKQIRNVDKVQIDFVKTPWSQQDKVYTKGKVFRTLSVDLGAKSYFSRDTVVEAVLPAGLYQINVKLNGSDVPADSYRYHNKLIVNSLVPIFSMSEKETVVTVLNRRTGQAVSGVSYRLKDSRDKSVKRGVTDGNGKFVISADLRKSLGNLANYEFYFKGDTISGRDYLYNPGPREKDTQVRYTATTGRGIYAPGDSVEWVLVVMKGDSTLGGQSASVRLNDSEGNVVDSVVLRTDAYGRVSGRFKIPEECRTGRFGISAKAGGDRYYRMTGSLTVSDFKAATAKIEYVYVLPEPQTKKCKVTGKVTVYNGSPAGGAEVLVNASLGNADEVVTVRGTTDSEGVFDVDFDYPPLRDNQSRYGGYGNADVTVTLNTGEVLTYNAYFNPRYPDRLRIAFKSNNEDGNINILKPLLVNVTLKDGAGKSIKTSVGWKLTTNDERSSIMAQGSAETDNAVEIHLPSDLRPGYYKLEVATTDSLLAEPARLYATYYRTNTSVLPDSTRVIWMPGSEVSVDGDMAKAYVGVSADATIVRCSYATEDGKLHFAEQTMPAGYSDFRFKVEGTIVGQITFYAVRDGLLTTIDAAEKKIERPAVRLSIGSFRDKAFAGQSETWNLTFVGADGQPLEGALVMDVYDSRLDNLAVVQPLRIQAAQVYGGGMNFSWLNNNSYLVRCSLPYKSLKETELDLPAWKYSVSSYNRNRMLRSMKIRGVEIVKNEAAVMSDYAAEAPVAVEYSSMKAVATGGSVAVNGEGAEMEEAAADDADSGSTPDFETVELRNPKSYLALWQPDLLVGKDGGTKVDFKLPNINTTWRVRGFAWTKDAQMAKIDTLMVTSKPVMVAVNAPRFIRRGDRAVLPVNVTNATDSMRQVAVNVEVGAEDGAPFAEITRMVELSPRSSQTVDIDFTATAKAVPDSVSEIAVTARAVCGDFSDGERVLMPVLASESRVTESVNFYMNPGEASVTLEVPRPKGTDFEAVLNFTANPMWTVVEALKAQKPDEVFSTSTANAQAYFTNAVILGLMRQHPELELQFKPSELRANMKKCMGVMKSLQGADGGFRWGAWSSREDLYSTEAVLEVFAILKRAGMYDGSADDMIAKACLYADGNVWRENSSNIDVLYTIIRPAFGPVKDVKGQKTIASTVNYILKNWKKQEAGEKALWACALWYSDNRNMARELLKSISQFGTRTAQKGFEFKNVRSLHAYALLLEAYGAIDPQSKEVDGIRQYLIVRRQGEAWERPYLTDEIVRSMIVSGTPWVSNDTRVSVTDDNGNAIHVTPMAKTGYFSVPVSGGEVTVSREVATAPAYGAVVARYTAPSGEIKAFSDGEVSITKQYNVRNADGSWRVFNEATDQFTVGDRVKVQLTVKASRPLSNVVVTDNRAATFEPVVQTSGWVYADGTGAYRENRDAVTNLYIDYLPQGTYILEYEVTANNAGSYSSGVADVTCTRAPDLTAHSAASPIRVTARTAQ